MTKTRKRRVSTSKKTKSRKIKRSKKSTNENEEINKDYSTLFSSTNLSGNDFEAKLRLGGLSNYSFFTIFLATESSRKKRNRSWNLKQWNQALRTIHLTLPQNQALPNPHQSPRLAKRKPQTLSIDALHLQLQITIRPMEMTRNQRNQRIPPLQVRPNPFFFRHFVLNRLNGVK